MTFQLGQKIILKLYFTHLQFQMFLWTNEIKMIEPIVLAPLAELQIIATMQYFKDKMI